jgi:hypothetical protein
MSDKVPPDEGDDNAARTDAWAPNFSPEEEAWLQRLETARENARESLAESLAKSGALRASLRFEVDANMRWGEEVRSRAFQSLVKAARDTQELALRHGHSDTVAVANVLGAIMLMFEGEHPSDEDRATLQTLQKIAKGMAAARGKVPAAPVGKRRLSIAAGFEPFVWRIARALDDAASRVATGDAMSAVRGTLNHVVGLDLVRLFPGLPRLHSRQDTVTHDAAVRASQTIEQFTEPVLQAEVDQPPTSLAERLERSANLAEIILRDYTASLPAKEQRSLFSFLETRFSRHGRTTH